MDTQVKNIDDLRLEIYRLRGVSVQQTLAIRERFSSFSATFSTIFSLFPKSQIAEGVKGSIFNQDIVQLISRFLLPFTLNNTLFKRSNAIIKALVRFASTRVSPFINEKFVGHIWDMIKSLIVSKTKKETI